MGDTPKTRAAHLKSSYKSSASDHKGELIAQTRRLIKEVYWIFNGLYHLLQGCVIPYLVINGVENRRMTRFEFMKRLVHFRIVWEKSHFLVQFVVLLAPAASYCDGFQG